MTAPAPADLERLLAEATGGEWYAEHDDLGWSVQTTGSYIAEAMDEADAKLLAAAKKHLPAILAERRQMREVAEQFRAALLSIATGSHTSGKVTRTMERGDMMTLAWETLKDARSAGLLPETAPAKEGT